MPTDPLAGFFMVPVQVDEDEDFQLLSAEQMGAFFWLMARCYRNRKPWTHRGLSLPAYSLITTYAALGDRWKLGGSQKQQTNRARRIVDLLKNRAWINAESAKNRYTVISLTKAERWQRFDTYRKRTSAEPAQNQRRWNLTTTTTSKRTTTCKDAILDLPASNPNEPYVAVADHIRAKMIEAGARCSGWKRDRAYASRQRELLSRAVKAVETDLEIPLEQQRAIITWAVTDPHRWGDDKDWSWLRVLDCPEIANRWKQKAPAIADAHDRATAKQASRLRVERYHAGPGASTIFYYYDGDREIERDEYLKRKTERASS